MTRLYTLTISQSKTAKIPEKSLDIQIIHQESFTHLIETIKYKKLLYLQHAKEINTQKIIKKNDKRSRKIYISRRPYDTAPI